MGTWTHTSFFAPHGRGAGVYVSGRREFDEGTKHALIELMNEQHEVTQLGGTMRLGAYPCELREGTLARKIYGEAHIHERHRHRYEVNPGFHEQLEKAGMVISGASPDGKLAEMVELPDHPYFVGCQFHPEFKSRPLEPHPLFSAFARAMVEMSQRRERASRS